MQIRCPNGKRNVRKVYTGNTVRQLFSAIQAMLLSNEATKTLAISGFDLKVGFPPKSLSADMDSTIEDAKLSNSSISVVARVR